VNKQLLFLLLIIFTTQNYGMKRVYRKIRKATPCKKQAVEKTIPYSFDLLPKDMQNAIIDFIINDTSERKPRIAADIFSNLARVNKKFNKLINHPEYKDNPLHSDNLIKKLSEKYHCSHESIAIFLHTQASLARLKLQRRINPLFNWKNNKSIERELNQLIKEGINLDFTYNHKNAQKTPLMRAIHSKTGLFYLLIKKGADVNASNTHGLTALKILLEPIINPDKLTAFLNQKSVNLNQQDKQGRTPLLHMLVNSKRFNTGPTIVFMKTLETFLQYNVDPELSNKRGLTPLTAAQSCYDQEPQVVNLILDAIERKKTKQITQ